MQIILVLSHSHMATHRLILFVPIRSLINALFTVSVYIYIYYRYHTSCKYVKVNLSIHPSIHPSIRPSVHPSILLAISLSLCVCLSVCLSVGLSVCLWSIRLLSMFAYVSIYLSIYLILPACLLSTKSCVFFMATNDIVGLCIPGCSIYVDQAMLGSKARLHGTAMSLSVENIQSISSLDIIT